MIHGYPSESGGGHVLVWVRPDGEGSLSGMGGEAPRLTRPFPLQSARPRSHRRASSKSMKAAVVTPVASDRIENMRCIP